MTEYRTTAIDIVVKLFGTLFMKTKGIIRTIYLSAAQADG